MHEAPIIAFSSASDRSLLLTTVKSAMSRFSSSSRLKSKFTFIYLLSVTYAKRKLLTTSSHVFRTFHPNDIINIYMLKTQERKRHIKYLLSFVDFFNSTSNISKIKNCLVIENMPPNFKKFAKFHAIISIYVNGIPRKTI